MTDSAPPTKKTSPVPLGEGIADPWSPLTQVQRPATGAQNTQDVAFVSAERRLQLIDQKGKAGQGTFGLALEYAIVQRELGHDEVVAILAQYSVTD